MLELVLEVLEVHVGGVSGSVSFVRLQECVCRISGDFEFELGFLQMSQLIRECTTKCGDVKMPMAHEIEMDSSL